MQLMSNGQALGVHSLRVEPPIGCTPSIQPFIHNVFGYANAYFAYPKVAYPRSSLLGAQTMPDMTWYAITDCIPKKPYPKGFRLGMQSWAWPTRARDQAKRILCLDFSSFDQQGLSSPSQTA